MAEEDSLIAESPHDGNGDDGWLGDDEEAASGGDEDVEDGSGQHEKKRRRQLRRHLSQLSNRTETNEVSHCTLTSAERVFP